MYSNPKTFEDTAGEQEFKVLNAQEARQLREKLPMVSPWRVVLLQFAAGLLCVVVAWLWSGKQSVAWSALYGVLATVVPSALLARGMTRRASSAVAVAGRFMLWEMMKIGVAIAMLVIASKVVPQLSWPALLLTMLVCIKMNWFALLLRGR